MIPHRLLILCGAMCSAGVLWAAALIAGLLAGVRLVPTPAAVGTAALLTIPGLIAGVLGNRWYYRTTRPRSRWSLTSWVPPHVPHWASMLAGVIFFGFWLAVVVAFAALDGNAEMRDGRYVIQDNGRVTVITEADYDRQLDHEQQISLGVLGALAVGGTFLTGAILTHHAAPEPTHTQSAGLPLA
ncbi:hypothetical protein GCM10010172_50540 [Paractinoplanes ferrugineus]|uniref:Uncharacterized protein n=1 Tax=Paractinoplanes ferrugineus TaxID=113564 RepID=A0A919J894_9ACTN|nr:hypothetical protein [Actinoplanes ferrugineus]GIE16375.1 hypothetical protein Afe05nite_82150 [Actinoplanes ferrugineus]